MSSVPPLRAGTVTVAHGHGQESNQIFMAAKAIWGIESHKLPQEKFDELKTVLRERLTREYGPYSVAGFGNVFVISADPKVLEPSYKSSPCSLGTCMVTDAALRCGRCKEAMYCSKEHQALDWKRHKVECIAKQT